MRQMGIWIVVMLLINYLALKNKLSKTQFLHWWNGSYSIKICCDSVIIYTVFKWLHIVGALTVFLFLFFPILQTLPMTWAHFSFGVWVSQRDTESHWLAEMRPMVLPSVTDTITKTREYSLIMTPMKTYICNRLKGNTLRIQKYLWK